MTVEELKEKYGSELVLCVSNKHLETSGMSLFDLIGAYGFLELRYDAELDFDSKQIIPYVVIRNGKKIFVTKRIDGDERLVGKMSIGEGGHIDRGDVVVREGRIDLKKTVQNCMNRELTEELYIHGNIGDYQFVEHFTDDSVEVSRVHLCLLYTIDVDGDIDIKETDKLVGEWMTVSELRKNYDNLENWSQIALDLLYPKRESKSVMRRKAIQLEADEKDETVNEETKDEE